jgi:hypothetical protein
VHSNSTADIVKRWVVLEVVMERNMSTKIRRMVTAVLFLVLVLLSCCTDCLAATGPYSALCDSVRATGRPSAFEV